MSTGAIIGIVIAVIVVVAVVVVASAEMRRARLRRQFGPEYDRLVEKLGSRRKADAELAERQRRVQALPIRELSAEQRASYSGDWAAVQERFVDTPVEAVGAAHTLIWNVMRDRGYPADDRTTSMDALAVHHGRSFEGYRKVQDLRPESATTEQLREAMIRYRALFEDLTGLREGHGEPAGDRVAEIRDRAAESRCWTRPLLTTARAPRKRRAVTAAPGTAPRHRGARHQGLPGRGLRGRGSRLGRTERRASRGERQPDRVPAPIATHIPLGTHGREIAMTQDQYGQTRGSGYVERGDVVPEDETEEARTEESEESRPMTRFQKVASALLGSGSERDEQDQAAGDRTARIGPR